jgi:hypothetical protein
MGRIHALLSKLSARFNASNTAASATAEPAGDTQESGGNRQVARITGRVSPVYKRPTPTAPYMPSTISQRPLATGNVNG